MSDSDKKNKTSEPLIYKLSNKSNYKSNLNDNGIIIQLSYVKIIHYYIVHYFENMNNKKKNIFIQGFNSITHIFLLLILYTKHLELTLYHCQNAIYYFIEYIGQITDKDDNMFFNLTLKDAVVYIYTKTIYEINEEHKQNFRINTEEELKIQYLQSFVYTYNKIINIIINENSFINEEIETKKDKLTNLRSNIENFMIFYLSKYDYKSLDLKLRNIVIECENKINETKEDVNNYDFLLELLSESELK